MWFVWPLCTGCAYVYVLLLVVTDCQVNAALWLFFSFLMLLLWVHFAFVFLVFRIRSYVNCLLMVRGGLSVCLTHDTPSYVRTNQRTNEKKLHTTSHEIVFLFFSLVFFVRREMSVLLRCVSYAKILWYSCLCASIAHHSNQLTTVFSMLLCCAFWGQEISCFSYVGCIKTDSSRCVSVSNYKP